MPLASSANFFWHSVLECPLLSQYQHVSGVLGLGVLLGVLTGGVSEGVVLVVGMVVTGVGAGKVGAGEVTGY